MYLGNAFTDVIIKMDVKDTTNGLTVGTDYTIYFPGIKNPKLFYGPVFMEFYTHEATETVYTNHTWQD